MKDNISENLKGKILKANIEVHRTEAEYYDIIKTELFNNYEQFRIRSSLRNIIKNLDEKSKVLDIGSGTGNLAIILLKKGFKNITCLDISNEMMDKLKEKVKDFDHNIKFVISDIDSFFKKSDLKYNLILMSSVLHHLPDYIDTLESIKRALDNKAVIYITHEPLPKQKQKSVIIKFLLKMDFLVYNFMCLLFQKIGKLKDFYVDYKYSDYHTGDRSLDIQQLEKIFKDGYKLKITKYSTAKFAIIAFLLFKFNYLNNFELVVSKM